jgi:hypothetical protein
MRSFELRELTDPRLLTPVWLFSDLERRRTLNSLPLAEERAILKEISRAQKLKLQVADYYAYDKRIKDKKVRRLCERVNLLRIKL